MLKQIILLIFVMVILGNKYTKIIKHEPYKYNCLNKVIEILDKNNNTNYYFYLIDDNEILDIALEKLYNTNTLQTSYNYKVFGPHEITHNNNIIKFKYYNFKYMKSNEDITISFALIIVNYNTYIINRKIQSANIYIYNTVTEQEYNNTEDMLNKYINKTCNIQTLLSFFN